MPWVLAGYGGGSQGVMVQQPAVLRQNQKQHQTFQMDQESTITHQLANLGLCMLKCIVS